MQDELLLQTNGYQDDEAIALQALQEKLEKPWDQLAPQDQAAVMEELLRRAGLTPRVGEIKQSPTSE